MSKDELHLDVYQDRSEYYNNGMITVFKEGRQSEAAQSRYNKVIEMLDKGYLYYIYDNCVNINTTSLDPTVKILIKDLINGITSEVGRGLVGLAFLQIAIKSIVPEQSIRLHKASNQAGKFSWVEGISMRTIDKNYSTPFLRSKGLLNINRDGVMMTRTLAENYPYSRLYKARMSGAFDIWIKIVDALESGIDYKCALAFMMSQLINKSNRFEEIARATLIKLSDITNYNLSDIENILINFFTNTKYSARAFEVVIHSFMQAYTKNGYTDMNLVKMSQMRSANKKHGNVGDIELKKGSQIYESWDAKYGKSYLYEELGELQDKLEENPGVSIAGFIVNDTLDLKSEIKEKIDEVSTITETDVKLFTFRDWVSYKLINVPDSEKDMFAKDWLVAVVESFARKRLDIAPIDEPCEDWLSDLAKLI